MSKATIEEHKKSQKVWREKLRGSREFREHIQGKPETTLEKLTKAAEYWSKRRGKILDEVAPEDRRRSKPIRKLRKFIKEQRGRSAASSAEKPDSNKRPKGKKGWSKGERCRMYSDTKCV